MEKVKQTVVQNKVEKDATFNILRMSNIPEQSAINELIDNALDAKATIIDINYSNKDISIKDNGFGMSAEILAEAFDVGNHINKMAVFGRYGYGLAVCSLRYAGEVEVITNDGNFISTRKFLTKDYAKPSIMDSIPSEGPTGTEVKLLGHLFKRKHSIIKQIGFYYGDLIEKGKLKVNVNGEPLESAVSKATVLQGDQQTASISWEGKRAIITAGLLAEGLPMQYYSQFAGANFIYYGKVIESGVKDLFAFREHSVSEVAFFVEIIDDKSKWLLSSNKDEVREKDELFSSEILQPMVDKWLDRGNQKRTIIQMVELAGFVTGILQDIFGNRKRATHTKDPEGVGAEPKDKHLRVDTDKPEKDRPKGKAKSYEFNIDWATVGELMRYSFTKKDKYLTIHINYKCEGFDTLVNNREAAKVYLMSIVTSFLTTDNAIDQDAIERRFGSNNFSVIFDKVNQSSSGVDLGQFVKEDASQLSREDRYSLVN